MKLRSLLLACLCTLSASITLAQAYDWSLFNGHKLSCTTSPPSGISALSGDPVNPSAPSYNFNSELTSWFNDAHNLVFSVNRNGIYDNAGTMIYPFDINAYNASPSSYSTAFPPSSPWPDWDYAAAPIRTIISANSEFEIIPVPQQCYQYYIMFWSVEIWGGSNALRLIKLDTYVKPIIIDDYILMIDGGAYPKSWHGIVADKPDVNGNRDIYTMDAKGSATLDLNIRKWTFNANGTLSFALPYLSSGTYTIPAAPSKINPTISLYGTKLHTVVEMTPDKKIAFINQAPSGGDFIYLYDVNTTVSSTLSYSNISLNGFEYVPALGDWFVSYFENTPSNNGGIGYFNSGGFFTPVTSTPGYMNQFKRTDLELARNGYLYLAGDPGNHMTAFDDPPAYTHYAYPGYLAYIDARTSSLSYVPAYFNDGGTPNVPIDNITNRGLVPNGDAYYIQNQIDNGDYAPRSYGSNGLYSINHLNSNIPACTSVHICSGGTGNLYFEPSFSGPGVSATQQYGISWYESDSCGNLLTGSPLNYTDAMHWGPVTSVNLFTYGGHQLASAGAQNKYFIVRVGITDWCKMISYVPHDELIKIDTKPPLNNWKISDDGSGTSFISPGNTCSVAPGACGIDPAINFSKAYVNKYWMIIKDYGTSCSTTPVVIGDGSANKTTITSSAPSFITEYLAEYMWGYSTSPAYSSLPDAQAVFGNPGEIYGVQLFTENDCGVTSNTEKFFIGGLSCKQGNTSVRGDLPKNTVSVKPNPANSFINIHLEGLNNAVVGMELYNMLGERVMNVIPRQEIKGELMKSADVSILPPGIYIYKCNINGTVTSGQLIINH